jgi:hypothetical protein
LCITTYWNSYAGRNAQEILNEYYMGNYEVEPMVSWGNGGPKRASGKSDIISTLLQVYPNPARDYFIVQLSMPNFVGSHQLQVIDASGKLIYQVAITNSREQLAIDAQQWSSGTYHILLLTEGKVIETKEINIVR